MVRLPMILRRTLLLGVFLFFAAGCASEKSVPKTTSSGDAAAERTAKFRTGPGDRLGTGLSAQSRDVEKDLGLR